MAQPYAPRRSYQPVAVAHPRVSVMVTNVVDVLGPDGLFQLIEEALNPNDVPPKTEEQLVAEVRRWFSTHDTKDERSEAARQLGRNNASTLHLMCKLYNPPADIIRYMVEAAPDVVGCVDTYGWLPLHYACNYGASTEVLEILIEAFPAGKTTQDSRNQTTPLHFYLYANGKNRQTMTTNNKATMITNVGLLSDTGACEIPDIQGMLPMHYACAYGTHPDVVKVLAEAFPESLRFKENLGRTPFHSAMANARFENSPDVIRFLLEADDGSTLNVRDDDKKLPIRLLCLGVIQNKISESDKVHVGDCLKLYLAAEPVITADFLKEIQALPDWLQDIAVISPHVRNILNKKIAQRFPTSILLMDFFMLMTIIVCFEIATTACMDYQMDMEGTTGGEFKREGERALLLLYVGATYFLLRELLQLVSLVILGAVGSWFRDTKNWLDMTVITFVFYYAILMDEIIAGRGWNDEEKENLFRAGIASGKAILWTAVIFFLKSTYVDFAVFLGGVVYVVKRLVAFLLAVLVILIAFAQIFFIIYTGEEVCMGGNDNETSDENQCEFDFPHCTFRGSFLKVYTMMMGEIGTQTRYDRNLEAQIFYVAFAFLVVILLSNVLIAIVTDSYEIIQNDRAAVVFWSNRLDFVSEMYGITKIRRRILCWGKKRGEITERGILEVPRGSTGRFREAWSNLWENIFDSSLDEKEDLDSTRCDSWVKLMLQAVVLVFIIPLWLLLGLLTLGVLWPPQVREYLLVEKKTVEGRAEFERRKLEQLKEIQNDINSLKGEINKQMATDRDDMVRMKAEVEAVQTEVLSDLQQIKELMSTLLDLGG